MWVRQGDTCLVENWARPLGVLEALMKMGPLGIYMVDQVGPGGGINMERKLLTKIKCGFWLG